MQILLHLVCLFGSICSPTRHVGPPSANKAKEAGYRFENGCQRSITLEPQNWCPPHPTTIPPSLKADVFPYGLDDMSRLLYATLLDMELCNAFANSSSTTRLGRLPSTSTQLSAYPHPSALPLNRISFAISSRRRGCREMRFKVGVLVEVWAVATGTSGRSWRRYIFYFLRIFVAVWTGTIGVVWGRERGLFSSLLKFLSLTCY